MPDNYPAIQAAINAAATDDVIYVRPGTYFENINFSGKSVSVISEQGSAVTTIDGGQHDSVVTFTGGEHGTLAGFTIRNGRSGFDTPGSATVAASESPIVRDPSFSRMLLPAIGLALGLVSPPDLPRRIFAKT